ncbi:hypothetical protein VF14_27080 [Nostoc linckia z18]|uniref:Uncharacterized protein n=2 Tax=Nostoc linckia TaxID=92942 RepID=A0A9Q5Z6B7_NOSLI|nr:hypothetical protein [Nostoc linckia]PHK29738.1 hypothetical protein VF12_30625 [Nostoc linckia z15]PHK42196.1 hypothetical protein VF13_30060 [Nostoc linckia z16]PHJ59448.1 hypothetical protein VF02_24890 [Nostoc linckia z1]PHJ62649.1 hypothetical protein VF05_26100 [Nostoc linckia z3]PHJ68801.1 hypothetical protein VF03_24370 [Nostoc linckia z2]
MAAGFVVVTLDDEGDPAEYWDGTAFQADVDLADFITTKTEARYVAGSNQAVRTDVDVVYKAATQDISLV